MQLLGECTVQEREKIRVESEWGEGGGAHVENKHDVEQREDNSLGCIELLR